MAGKPKNRLELRRQYEAAEPIDPMEDEPDDLADEAEEEDSGERKPKKKVKPVAKTKTAKVPKPAARMRVVWSVVNDAFKPVGTFEYSQKEAAYARAAELMAKGKGTHFVQRLKEPMPEGSLGLGASISAAGAEAAAAAAKAAKASKNAKTAKDTRPSKTAKAPVVVEDEIDDAEIDADASDEDES